MALRGSAVGMLAIAVNMGIRGMMTICRISNEIFELGLGMFCAIAVFASTQNSRYNEFAPPHLRDE